MKNYREIIKEADWEGKFNDADNLTDFLDRYLSMENPTIEDIKDEEDNINKHVDSLCPTYYHDIVKQWQKNSDCHGLTVDICGEYAEKDIYKMMTSDLYFYYEQQLREDYNVLIGLLDNQE